MKNSNLNSSDNNVELQNLPAEIIIQQLSEFREMPANEDILEVTYKYTTLRDKNGYFQRSMNGDILAYNDIFPALTHLDYQSASQDGEKVLQIASEEIERRQNFLKNLQTEIEKSELKNNEKKMLISTIQSYINRFEITKTGLVFELEKAWIIIEISESEKFQKIAKIEALQTEEFGNNVGDSWVASEQVCYKIRQNFAKNGGKFSPEEKKRFEELYDKIRNYIFQKHQQEIPALMDFVEEKPLRDDLKKFEKIKIPREEYIQIFQMVIDMMGLPQRVEINPNLSSIFDGEKILGIPASDEYSELSLSRILELVSHEIRGHSVNQRNGEKLAGGIRSAGDIEKEEGLAMAMEGLLHGYNFLEIIREKRGVGEARVIAGEVFSGHKKDFKDFISLNKKASTGEADVNEALIRRASRNLPFGYSQKKDLSYGLWLQKVVDYLEKDGDIKKLFSGKFWLDHITSGDADFSKSKDILFPFFVEDIIIFYLTERDRTDEERKLNHENFLLYLKEKYKHILNEEDFKSVEKLSYACVRRVWEILSFIKTNMKK